MGLELLTERHAAQIAGVLGCYDRMLIFGTLPGICYAGGMTSFLYAHQVRIFDYAKFAEPYRDQIRENAERMAAAAGIEIEFIRTRSIRKEDRAQELLAKRGDHPGLVCILSAMEPCSTYKPWHNKQSGKTYLVPNDGKCLHYYFYFVDEELGFCHVRVPTWLPCRLQICLNGHNWLAGRLREAGIEYRMADNAFTHLGDWQKAQAIYGNLTRTAIHTVKPDNIATFLGKKLSTQFEGEMGNRFNIRIEGTRIKHTMGPVSLKLYDKFGLMGSLL